MKEQAEVRIMRLCDLKFMNLITVFWETVRLAEKAASEKAKLGDETIYMRTTSGIKGESYRIIEEVLFKDSLKYVSGKREATRKDQALFLRAFADLGLIKPKSNAFATNYSAEPGNKSRSATKPFIRIPTSVYEMLGTWERIGGRL